MNLQRKKYVANIQFSLNLSQMLKDLHTRISNAIDLGYVESPDDKHMSISGEHGLNILGNIVQGNADTVNKRYYRNIDKLCKKVFGFGLETNDEYHTVPGALDMYSTSLRDPIFYSLYKHIVSYYLRFVLFYLILIDSWYLLTQFSFPYVVYISLNYH